ncbi:MAG: permease prefix domain 2-containing transporter, partial [Bacteroidota bacterium]
MKHHSTPPKFYHRFLAWYCHPALFEELEGDLLEHFQSDQENKGETYARRRFRREVIRLFRPSVIRPISWSNNLIHPAMLKNYLKVAFRNLWKHKDSSAINIMGLCIGLCGCILIALFVHDEYQFDQHHSDLDQLHRIYVETFNQDELYKMASTSPRLAPSLVQEFPEVQASLLVYKINQNQLFEYEGQSIMETKGFFTQNAIFQFFDLPFLSGDPKTALQEPNTIVLTEALANKYFGVENPIGK